MDLRQSFVEKTRAVNSEVHASKDLTAACGDIAAWLAGQGLRCVAVAGFDENTTEAIKERCAAQDIVAVTEDLAAHQAGLEAGLTPANWGLAATGSLVIDSGDEALRLASQLPPMHLAILDSANLAPEARSIEPELTRAMKDGSAYFAFITGPSRTADIERVLTIGVHGPERLIIWLTGEDE